MTGADRVRGQIPLVVSALPLLAALVLTYRDGGYFIDAWGVACIALLGMLATAVLLIRSSLGGLVGMIALAGWGGLAAWQGLSSLWADEPTAATSAMSLTLLYAAAFGLVLVASNGAPTLRRLLELSLLLAVVVGVSSVGQRILPDVIPGHETGGRLATPISYWNTLALAFAFGLVLAIGIAGDATRGRVVRALCAATPPLFALGILFTQSRGSLLVAVVGVVLLIAVAPGRLITVWSALVAAVVSVPLMAYANDQTALRAENVLEQPHAAAGARVAIALLIAAAVGAAASLYVTPLSEALGTGRRSRIAGIAVGGVVVVVLLGLLVARPPEGGPVSWADRQYDAFRSYDPGARNNADSVSDRLVVAAGSGRWQNWSVAYHEFEDAPIAGTGAGDYRFRWNEYRDVNLTVRNAHSLYLETLGESGLVGLLLLLTPLVAVGVAIAMALLAGAPPALARDLGIVAGAGGAVALHLGGDWGWQMPAVVLPAMVIGAAAIAASAIHLGRDRPGAAPRVVGRRRGRADRGAAHLRPRGLGPAAAQRSGHGGHGGSGRRPHGREPGRLTRPSEPGAPAAAGQRPRRPGTPGPGRPRLRRRGAALAARLERAGRLGGRADPARRPRLGRAAGGGPGDARSARATRRTAAEGPREARRLSEVSRRRAAVAP